MILSEPDRLSISESMAILIGVISCLRPLLLLCVVFDLISAVSSAPANADPNHTSTPFFCDRPELGSLSFGSIVFFGLPLGFLSGVAISLCASTSCFFGDSGMIFRLPPDFGFGVPDLFTGLLREFLGRPLPFFSTAGGVSSPPFKGTVVVVVSSVRHFAGDFSDLCISSTGSAWTVRRIRQGLVDRVVCLGDFLGETLRIGCGEVWM